MIWRGRMLGLMLVVAIHILVVGMDEVVGKLLGEVVVDVVVHPRNRYIVSPFRIKQMPSCATLRSEVGETKERRGGQDTSARG